jgi:tricorn protease
MQSQSRGIVGFTVLGVVLVGVALLATRMRPSGVATLPDVKAAPAATAPGAPKLPTPPPSQGGPLRIFQEPTLSRTQIAFVFAGEIWVVPREGGDATRLVTGQLRNHRPLFSPDGSMIAYSGEYDGNLDVYVVPATGGEPRRLTYHPGPETAVAWTPDGKSVLFESMRDTPRDLPKLFTMPVAGGPPEEVPLPSGTNASYSPDGKRLAYVPYPQWQPEWKK